MKNLQEITVGNLETYRNFIYIDDIANVMVKIAQNMGLVKNNIFNIAESNASIKSVLDLLCQMSEKYTRKKCSIITDAKLTRSGSLETSRFSLDCKKIKNTLNWSPEFDLKSGIEETFTFEIGVEKY